MAKPHRPWTVLSHDPIERLEDDLWVVEADLPKGPVRRRMSIVRLGDGRLALHNAIPLHEPDMQAVEAFGRPAILVVPSGFHRLDVHAWKERYPALVVLCAAPVRARVEEEVRVDGTFADLPPDPVLRAEPLDGSRTGEAAFHVRSGGRTSLLFGDTVMNIPPLPGLPGLFFRLIGSTGGARVTPLARRLSVSDPGALAAHLARLARTPGLARLVPSHGEIVAQGAAETLRAVANRLAPGHESGA